MRLGRPCAPTDAGDAIDPDVDTGLASLHPPRPGKFRGWKWLSRSPTARQMHHGHGLAFFEKAHAGKSVVRFHDSLLSSSGRWLFFVHDHRQISGIGHRCAIHSGYGQR